MIIIHAKVSLSVYLFVSVSRLNCEWILIKVAEDRNRIILETFLITIWRVDNVKPDKDILYLPFSMENKEFSSYLFVYYDFTIKLVERQLIIITPLIT